MENQVATTNEIKKTKKRKNSNSQMLEWKKDGWKALISLAPAMIILIISTGRRCPGKLVDGRALNLYFLSNY